MSTNRLTTWIFGATLAGALAMLVASRLQERAAFPPGSKSAGSTASRSPRKAPPSEANGLALRSDAAIASPFALGFAADEGDEIDDAPARPARPSRPSVYQGPTWFDDEEEKIVTRLSSDRPEEVRFAPRDVDHVERREDGETVIVLRRGPSVLVTDELLEAAPEALRDRIAYEGPPPGESTPE